MSGTRNEKNSTTKGCVARQVQNELEGSGGPPQQTATDQNLTPNTTHHSGALLPRVQVSATLPPYSRCAECEREREPGSYFCAMHAEMRRHWPVPTTPLPILTGAPHGPLADQAEVPTLTGYRHPDRAETWVYCEHERRWHVHGCCTGRCAEHYYPWEPCGCPLGAADGTRSAHCTCRHAPYGQYLVQEAGYLTPEVLAAHREAPLACLGCQEQGECSCDATRCEQAECGMCAPHADPYCSACWQAHGRPGYGHCEDHGIVPVHAHATAGHCDLDASRYCHTALLITRYIPRKGTKTAHLHCPYCAVLHYLTDHYHRVKGTRPLCRGCRVLVNDNRIAHDMARIVPGWTPGARRPTRREATGVSA